MVRAEFGRMPLIMNAHAKVWNHIKYLKKKVEKPLVQKSYDIDSDPEVRDSLFRECDNRYRVIIAHFDNLLFIIPSLINIILPPPCERACFIGLSLLNGGY